MDLIRASYDVNIKPITSIGEQPLEGLLETVGPPFEVHSYITGPSEEDIQRGSESHLREMGKSANAYSWGRIYHTGKDERGSKFSIPVQLLNIPQEIYEREIVLIKQRAASSD